MFLTTKKVSASNRHLCHHVYVPGVSVHNNLLHLGQLQSMKAVRLGPGYGLPQLVVGE